MKKSYILEGLECANCAAKIEKAVSELPEVTSATVNFMTSKMTIECEKEQLDEITKKAVKIVKSFEPDVCVRKA